MIIKNFIGWEDEHGNQVAYSKEFAFMNCSRHPNHVRPVWKEVPISDAGGKKQ